jgi:hypothetical protein
VSGIAIAQINWSDAIEINDVVDRRGDSLSTNHFERSKRGRNFRSVKNNSNLIFLLSGLLACAAANDSYAASEKASYGTRVKYQARQKIEFPDFTIEFVGERRQSSPTYPRGFLYYDFKVSNGKIEKTVSWSAGTGDIGPLEFEAGDKHYQLELRRSDKLGKLNDNELVIWRTNRRS